MGRNVVTRRISVGTEVKKLVGENPKRKALLVYNNGSATVYILGSRNNAVTDGMPVPPGSSYSDNESTGALYIVAESGTQNVRVETIGE